MFGETGENCCAFILFVHSNIARVVVSLGNGWELRPLLMAGLCREHNELENGSSVHSRDLFGLRSHALMITMQ